MVKYHPITATEFLNDIGCKVPSINTRTTKQPIFTRFGICNFVVNSSINIIFSLSYECLSNYELFFDGIVLSYKEFVT